MYTIAKWLGRGISTIISIALIIVVWTKWPWIIVKVLDFNLAGVKLACGLLPADYGAMAEAAIRLGFSIDVALLLLGVNALIKGVFALPPKLFHR